MDLLWCFLLFFLLLRLVCHAEAGSKWRFIERCNNLRFLLLIRCYWCSLLRWWLNIVFLLNWKITKLWLLYLRFASWFLLFFFLLKFETSERWCLIWTLRSCLLIHRKPLTKSTRFRLRLWDGWLFLWCWNLLHLKSSHWLLLHLKSLTKGRFLCLNRSLLHGKAWLCLLGINLINLSLTQNLCLISIHDSFEMVSVYWLVNELKRKG